MAFERFSSNSFLNDQEASLSESINELICYGEDVVVDAILHAIDGWYDYHQKEADNWLKLKTVLRTRLLAAQDNSLTC